jgi:AcrR family transcriptional regulator
MGTRSTDRGVETRNRLIAVAAELFMRQGYSATSLNDIISAAGLTKGGFYFQFPSKAVLALAVLQATRGHSQDQILATAGLHERAVGQIAAMVRAAAESKGTMPAIASLSRLCLELASEPEVAEELRPFEFWMTLTAQLFDRAKADGDMDPAIDSAAAARFAVNAFVGTDHLCDLASAPLDPAMVDDYLAFVFRAVGISADVPPRGTNQSRPGDTETDKAGAKIGADATKKETV